MLQIVTLLSIGTKLFPSMISHPFMNFSGGISITVTGENVDSVKEPIMVVVVKVGVTVSIYYQVNTVMP